MKKTVSPWKIEYSMIWRISSVHLASLVSKYVNKEVFILLTCAVALVGCGQKVPDDLRQYIHPNGAAQRQFQSLPVDRQIEIYLEIVRTRKPPNELLGHMIARYSENVIPTVQNRLRSETDDDRKEDLITLIIFRCHETRDCQAYPNLDSDLKAAAETIQNPELKRRVLYQITEIGK